jgi:hypothetical protein
MASHITYQIVDGWAARRGLVSLGGRGGQVLRSYQLSGPHGHAQLWLENGLLILVHIWDFGARRETLLASTSTLEARLDDALNRARAWCGLAPVS